MDNLPKYQPIPTNPNYLEIAKQQIKQNQETNLKLKNILDNLIKNNT